MASKYGRNFTNFQNVGIQGSPTSAPIGAGMIEMKPGLTQSASTISLSMIPGGIAGSQNGENEHPYLHISNAGLSIGTGFIRLTQLGSSPYGTIRLRATYLDTDTAYQLPAKSGTFPISGTFTINMPAVAAGSFGETNVVVSGIREEDALTVIMNRTYETTGVTTNRGAFFLAGARPYNGNIAITFFNPTATATAYNNLVMGYTAMR